MITPLIWPIASAVRNRAGRSRNASTGAPSSPATYSKKNSALACRAAIAVTPRIAAIATAIHGPVTNSSFTSPRIEPFSCVGAIRSLVVAKVVIRQKNDKAAMHAMVSIMPCASSPPPSSRTSVVPSTPIKMPDIAEKNMR